MKYALCEKSNEEPNVRMKKTKSNLFIVFTPELMDWLEISSCLHDILIVVPPAGIPTMINSL
ncbi:MAG TPA: hypothetical protein DGH68_11645 [Bacteroidetes bacterium]|nr:hypothetical protein [Bacteroidota bacterium]